MCGSSHRLKFWVLDQISCILSVRGQKELEEEERDPDMQGKKELYARAVSAYYCGLVEPELNLASFIFLVSFFWFGL